MSAVSLLVADVGWLLILDRISRRMKITATPEDAHVYVWNI
jgi:hypothetical protein